MLYLALEIAELIDAASFYVFAIVIEESIDTSTLIYKFEVELVRVVERRIYFCNLEAEEIVALEICGQLGDSDILIHIY